MTRLKQLMTKWSKHRETKRHLQDVVAYNRVRERQLRSMQPAEFELQKRLGTLNTVVYEMQTATEGLSNPETRMGYVNQLEHNVEWLKGFLGAYQNDIAQYRKDHEYSIQPERPTPTPMIKNV